MDVVVHLDLNKTVLIADPAGGLSLEDSIASILASSAFGRVTHFDGAPPTWTLVDPMLATAPAEPDLMNYNDFIKEVRFPFREVPRSATDEERAAAMAYNKGQKDAGRRALSAFTARGEPGAVFAPVLDALMAKLRVPSDSVARCAATGLAGFRDGTCFLLPCYFRLLNYLRQERPDGSRFVVILRTFGTDSADVIAEHNAWCEGKHPLLKPDGPQGHARDLVLRCPHDTAALSRCGSASRDTSMATVQCKSDHALRARKPAEAHAAAASAAASGPVADGFVRMVIGYRDIYSHFVAQLPPRRERAAQQLLSHAAADAAASAGVGAGAGAAAAAAGDGAACTADEAAGSAALAARLRAPAPGKVLSCVDDYWHWSAHGEQAFAGKLLPLDFSGSVASGSSRHARGSATGSGTAAASASAGAGSAGSAGSGGRLPPFQVFFDDNIGCALDSARILSTKDIGSLPIHPAYPSWDSAAHAPFCAAAAAGAAAAEPVEDGIVDVRDIHTGRSLPLAATKNIHLARASALAAILNEDYYVELLQFCERNWLAARAAGWQA